MSSAGETGLPCMYLAPHEPESLWIIVVLISDHQNNQACPEEEQA